MFQNSDFEHDLFENVTLQFYAKGQYILCLKFVRSYRFQDNSQESKICISLNEWLFKVKFGRKKIAMY